MDDFTKKLTDYQKEAEERFAQKKAEESGLEYLNLLGYPIDPEALALLDEKKARKANLVPLKKEFKYLEIACLDPESKETKNILEEFEKKDYKIKLFVVSKKSLDYALGFYKFVHKPKGKIVGLIEIKEEDIKNIDKKELSLEEVKEEIEQFKKTKIGILAEIIFAGGILLDASDIHLEPKENEAILRYRLDGLLYEAAALDLAYYHKLLNRIKLLAGMKLNIKDAPQDGRFTIKFKGIDIEIRTSVVPSEYGEMIVLRILNPKAINLTIKDLGFRDDHLKIVKREISRPNGLILNTGPTGSGKTTTLYTFLRHKQNPTIKIITIEDPIEYRLEGIDQTQIDRAAGYTFASGLRSLLRHDPDVILVGEIRDKETAEIAMQSSLTGHLVFSTLHTNDAVGAVPRLIEMGVNPSIVASALSMSIAQRLVRRLCPKCTEFKKPPKEFLKALEKVYKKLPEETLSSLPKIEEIKIGYPKDCKECQQGYKGRIGVFELFVVDEEIEKLINQKPTHAQLFELAVKKGMTTMQEDALIKIALGITSIEEAERVLGKLY